MGEMVNSPAYINKVQQFLSSHSSFILKKLIDNEIDEIETRFLGKCTGFIVIKNDNIKKVSVHPNLKNAVQNNDLKYLRRTLMNTIYDYNESVKKESDRTNIIISQTEFEELEDLHINYDFIDYIIEHETDVRIADKSLGITLLLLIDALEIKPKLIYNKLNIDRPTKVKYVRRTIKNIKNIIEQHIPEIHLEEIESKIQAKKRLLQFITKNHSEVRKRIRVAEHLKGEIRSDNYKHIEGELHKLIDELRLEPSRTANMKRYIKEHYYPKKDDVSVLEVIENVHVWQKEFNALAQFIRSFDIATTNPMK